MRNAIGAFSRPSTGSGIAVGASVLLAVVPALTAQQVNRTAAEAMGAARRAVVAADAIPLRSLRIMGELQVTNTDGSKASCPVEIRILLPSSYLRIERQTRFLRQSGFDGSTLLNDLKPYARSSPAVVNYGADQIEIERARMRRLLLGIAAVVLPESQPTAIETTSMRGREVDVVRLADVTIKELALAIDRVEHYPLVVVATQSVALPVRSGEALSGPPPRQRTPVEQWFEDRRAVGAYRFPFLIRTVAGDMELERLTVQKFEPNAPLGPADFAK